MGTDSGSLSNLLTLLTNSSSRVVSASLENDKNGFAMCPTNGQVPAARTGIRLLQKL